MKQRLVLAAVLAAAAVPLPAHAQAWLSDRRASEGMGIRTGNLELHPGLGAEFGYDTNYFLRAGDGTPNENVISIYRLRVTPSLSLSTLGAERRGLNPGTPPAVIARASIFADYSRLFAVDSNDSATLDRSGVQNPINVGANLRLDIMPQRPMGEDLFVDYQRVAQPSPDSQCLDAGCNKVSVWDRDSIRAGAGLTWRPGGGLFEWRFGYELTYNMFESSNFKNYDNLQHAIQTRGRWRFLPRTALIYDGEYRFIRYTGNGSSPAPADGDTLRSRVGLNGLITPRVSLLGMVGWESSFYKGAPQNADTILAAAEAKYFVLAPPGLDAQAATTGLSTIALGMVREISNSYISSYYTRTGGYAQLVYFQGGAFVSTLDGAFNHYSFPRGVAYEAFTQNRIAARLFAEYRFSNSFGLNGTVMFDQNMSDRLNPRLAQATPVDNLDYSRWQAFIGLRWFM